MHPFRIQRRHALLPADHQRRLQFCQWLNNHQQRFFTRIVVGDEAAFHMNGKVNTWNVRNYAPRGNAPDFHFDVPHNLHKLTVWIGLVGDGHIIGPIFFDRNVNGAAYLQMLNNDVTPNLVVRYDQQRNGAIPHLWWMQDGAPAHRARAVHDQLQGLFPRRVAGLGHPT